MLPPRWQRVLDDLDRCEEESESIREAPMLGRFVVMSRIGSGGMGAVFEAIDPDLDRTVALKICKLPPDAAAGMIEHEARCLAQLAHPNVVMIYDVVRDGPDLILVMEYVKGQTLRAWLRTTAPTWPTILDRYTDAAHGLMAAHEQRLEHGDFKPDNVLVGDDGRVRVIDFGIARHSYDLVDDQLDLERRGTRSYMAPERLREEGGGMRADIYSFCVSVWESLYGARPYQGETVAALLDAIETGQPRKATTALGVPAAIESVIRRGLSERASERPSSMVTLVGALNRAREADERRRVRRRRWFWGGLGGVIGIGVFFVLRREPRLVEPEPVAVVFEEPQPDAIAQTLALAVDAMHEGLPDSAIQYLELARKRAHMDDDDVALRRVAEQAEALGDEFALRGDKLRAQQSWDIAYEIAGALHDQATVERLNLKHTPRRQNK